MLGGLGNLTGLFKQAKEFQERMGAMQKELEAKRFDGEAGAGAVRATVNGKGILVDIKIDREAANDVELLEDMVKAAVAVATQKAQDGVREQLGQLTGGMNIPGLMDMLGQQESGS